MRKGGEGQDELEDLVLVSGDAFELLRLGDVLPEGDYRVGTATDNLFLVGPDREGPDLSGSRGQSARERNGSARGKEEPSRRGCRAWTRLLRP